MGQAIFIIFTCIELLFAVERVRAGVPQEATVHALAAIAFATLAVATKPERRKP